MQFRRITQLSWRMRELSTRIERRPALPKSWVLRRTFCAERRGWAAGACWHLRIFQAGCIAQPLSATVEHIKERRESALKQRLSNAPGILLQIFPALFSTFSMCPILTPQGVFLLWGDSLLCISACGIPQADQNFYTPGGGCRESLSARLHHVCAQASGYLSRLQAHPFERFPAKISRKVFRLWQE